MNIKSLLEQKQTRKEDWVKIPGTEVSVLVKYLLPMDLDQIGKRRSLYKKVGGKMDFRLYREAVMIETVKDWKGLELEEGVPFPCTPENTIELDKIFAPFREVWFKASGLAREVEEEEDDELGN